MREALSEVAPGDLHVSPRAAKQSSLRVSSCDELFKRFSQSLLTRLTLLTAFIALLAPAAFQTKAAFQMNAASQLKAVSQVNAASQAKAAAESGQARTAQIPSGRTRSSLSVATLAAYSSRVREAVAPLEDLAAFCEFLSRSATPKAGSKDGSESDLALEFPKREMYALGRVRGLVPPKERVEWGGGFVEVDNGWLHAALDELKKIGDNDRRARALRSAAGRLRALAARLAELEGGAAGGVTDKDAERGRLNAILRAAEFNRQPKQQGGALQRLVGEVFDWVRSHFPDGGKLVPGASPRASLLAQVVVLALCLAVVGYVARRLWARRGGELRTLKLKRGPRVVLGERLEADKTAADLLDDAERLARAGDLRGAIRKAYVALLCELGDRGIVRPAQHCTNRDYLNAVRRNAPTRLYTEMLPLTFDFEMHWYGLRDASNADWENFRARCRQALRS
ncbi:MAG: hypothetical protein QOJ76_3467 [Acidobacteriota bacterium]|jgi:hypothetical protein|nr:hypothetical protein [Acidobacteriota bacterium]